MLLFGKHPKRRHIDLDRLPDDDYAELIDIGADIMRIWETHNASYAQMCQAWEMVRKCSKFWRHDRHSPTDA